MSNVLRLGKQAFVYAVVAATIAWAIGLASLVPLTAQAATLSGGDLIKASGSAVYYYGADGKRYVFPNETTYKSWYADFSNVKTITDDDLAAIAIGGNVTMRAGTKLVKITTDPKVYAVEPGGVLRWIETEAIAKSLYGDNWASRVVDVPDAFFTNYSSGSSISTATYPTGSLVKVSGSADVYYIDGTTKRKIDNEAALSGNLFQSDNILTASDLSSYTDGPVISGTDSTLTNVAGGAAAATGPLTVALAADSPAAASVATSASANFAKVTFTAGENAVNITSLYVTRYGLSSNSDLENIKLVGMDGASVGSIGSLNTNGKALLTFSPALSIAANSSASYYLRAGIVSGATSGNTAALGIDSAADVTSNAASVAGTFPVKGSSMSVTGVTVGTVTVDSDGTVTDSSPDAGDTNVVVNKFKVTAGSTEAVTIESLTLEESGSASLSDTANIELYSVTESKSLGEVASWNSQGRVTFSDLNLVVDKGDIYRFEVREDIVSGAGLHVNADLTDGSDIMINVKGNSYGFYLTPSLASGSTWNGQGSNDQIINSGSLTVSKSTATPATGNVARADNQTLAVFDFDAKGEQIKISSLRISFDLGTITESEVTNVKVLDENGTVVAGPKDLDTTDYTANGTTYEGTVTFTDLIIVPIGVHQYSVTARIANATSTGDTIVAGIADADSDITAKGFTTNDSITASPTATNVNGNTQTVRGGTLSATTLSQPANRNVAKGVQDYVWATFSLDANNSGEDIQVTSLGLTDTVGGTGTGDFGDIDNLEIWCDLTSSSSSRGDVYETKVSDTEAPTGTTATVTLTQTVTVAKDNFVKCAVVGDLSTSATTDDTHTINLTTGSATVVATGADTGQSANATPTGAGQPMTVKTSGVLTVTVDSSSPQAQLIAGNSTGVTTAVFRLAADEVENLDLDYIKITDDGSSGNTVVTYYFYSSARADGGSTSDPIASKTGGATAEVYLSDGTVTIPADSYVLITVKADMAAVDGNVVSNGDNLEVTIASGDGGDGDITDNDGDVRTTGNSGGSTIDGSAGSDDAATHSVFESYPTVAFASDTPAGTLVPSANTLLAKVAVTAASANDITFESADSNSIIFSVAASRSDDDSVTETWTLKDQDGLTLDTVTADIAASTITFDFTDNSFTVPAGQTKYLYVYANTTDLETTGDSIQLWLDDGNSGNNIDWGIDSANGSADTGYNKGDIIFRGDLYGGALAKP